MDDGYGAYHSRSVVMGGSAILDAATKLREAIRAQAAQRLDCQPSDVEIVEGVKAVGPGGKAVALTELSSISAEGAFLNKKHTYTYGAHAAHVAVDAKLGHVELLDYVIVEDCGRMINPLTLRGQAIGSAVQGLGGATMEHLAYDDQGQLRQFINIYRNDEDIRFGSGLQTRLQENDDLSIVPAVAGG